VSRRADRPAYWLASVLIAAGFPVAVGVFRAVALPMNHDVAWLLYLSGRVLDGARLYVEMIEVNPPLVVWAGIPMILLERVTGVSHTLLFPVVVAVGAAGSLVACWRLSRGLVADTYRAPLLGALATALFVIPSGDWGQREHLTLIMTAPYLLGSAMRARGLDLSTRSSWWVGLVAGIGFALKPHFLIVLLAVETWLIVSSRSRAIVGLVAASTIAAYGVTVVLLVPDYLTLMTEIGAVYTRYSAPPLWRTAVHTPSLLVALALPLAFVRGESRELRIAFGIACGAWWLVAMVQGKVFFYHHLPGLGAAMVLLILALSATGGHRRAPHLAMLPPLVISFLVALAASYHPRGDPARWQRIQDVASIAVGDSVLILSHSHRDAWPAVNYSKATWTFSLPSTWPARPEVGAVEYAARHTARALADRPVVLVTRRPHNNPLAALLEQPEFRDAWVDYIPSDSLLHYQVFRPRSAD
jgi:hypothetical protein